MLINDQIFKNNYQIKVKNYTTFLLMLFLMNTINVKGSERTKDFFESIQKDNQIDKLYYKNSITFSEYDNFNNQLRTFLGLNSIPYNKSYYPDIMLIKNSESIREIYKSKLNNMTFNKNNYIIRNKSIFKD